MLPKYHNEQLPVADNHSQLRKMTSEVVDPIDWLLSPTLYRDVPIERHFHMQMQFKNQESVVCRMDA